MLRLKIKNKVKILNVPDVRQSNDYTCGTSSLLSILSYYGKYDGNEKDLAKELGTNYNDGTKPENIVNVAKKYGLDSYIKQNTTLDDLRHFLDNDIPVIINYQAWSDKKKDLDSWSRGYGDGHYSVLIGLDENNIYLEDPSMLGARGEIPLKEFMARWHDMDGKNKKYKQMCIVAHSNKKPPEEKFRKIK